MKTLVCWDIGEQREISFIISFIIQLEYFFDTDIEVSTIAAVAVALQYSTPMANRISRAMYSMRTVEAQAFHSIRLAATRIRIRRMHPPRTVRPNTQTEISLVY